MRREDASTLPKKLWYFLWYDNSVWSWVVNIALAFLLIKFAVFPGLGFLLGTSHPIVAVVSNSMEQDGLFDAWWAEQQQWYLLRNITREQFAAFPFRNGFNKGDIMVLRGKDAESIEVGDILVFESGRPNPIIHRVVRKWRAEGQELFQTKGDHNGDSIAGGFVDEMAIREERVIGAAVLRVPLLGWIKIWFVELIELVKAAAGG